MGNRITQEDLVDVSTIITPEKMAEILYLKDERSARAKIAEAEGRRVNIATCYTKKVNSVNLLVGDDPRETVATYSISTDADLIRNLRVVNPEGVIRSTLSLVNPMTGQETIVEEKTISEVKECSVGFADEFFPRCAVENLDLVLELTVNTKGLENIVNGDTYVQYENIFLMVNQRMYLKSSAPFMKDANLVFYNGDIKGTYLEVLEKTRQVSLIDRLSKNLSNLVFDEIEPLSETRLLYDESFEPMIPPVDETILFNAREMKDLVRRKSVPNSDLEAEMEYDMTD